eukprot:Sspe_Gene.57007::Locus_31311_Transcript_1_1_Confidence_1.000_Length_1419::g.57007::m.57007
MPRRGQSLAWLNSSASVRRPGDWVCSCGCRNFGWRTTCFQCKQASPAAPASPPSSDANKPSGWELALRGWRASRAAQKNKDSQKEKDHDTPAPSPPPASPSGPPQTQSTPCSAPLPPTFPPTTQPSSVAPVLTTSLPPVSAVPPMVMPLYSMYGGNPVLSFYPAPVPSQQAVIAQQLHQQQWQLLQQQQQQLELQRGLLAKQQRELEEQQRRLAAVEATHETPHTPPATQPSTTSHGPQHTEDDTPGTVDWITDLLLGEEDDERSEAPSSATEQSLYVVHPRPSGLSGSSTGEATPGPVSPSASSCDALESRPVPWWPPLAGPE